MASVDVASRHRAEWQQAKYATMRDMLTKKRAVETWDVVVLTCADEQQRLSYVSNVEALLSENRVPEARLGYHVVPDPGRRVGCGGSTMEEKLGMEVLTQSKILLLHAGGYSKRMPNHSACGKIFSLLPLSFSGPPCTMLELKMAMFIDVPRMAPPGVLLTCADDICVFDSTPCDFSHPGITAFGHPSTLEIGTGHGVFCVEQTSESGAFPVRRFIHKPSFDLMRAQNAIIPGTDPELVLTDSAFFFDHDVSKALLRAMSRLEGGEVRCEVDAYGDFLQPPRRTLDEAKADYIGDFSNYGTGTEKQDLMDARVKLFEELKDVGFWVISLPESIFYHIGTIPECVDHFCREEAFLREMGGSRLCGCKVDQSALLPESVCGLCSVFGPGCRVGRDTLVELSNIEANSGVGDACVVSGVTLPPGSIIPDRIFIQTVAVDCPHGVSFLSLCFSSIIVNNQPERYVTHVVSVDDDLKVSGSEGTLVPFCGCESVESLQTALGLPPLWEAGEPKSLWTARLFPVAATPSESMLAALRLLKCADALRTGAVCPNPV